MHLSWKAGKQEQPVAKSLNALVCRKEDVQRSAWHNQLCRLYLHWKSNTQRTHPLGHLDLLEKWASPESAVSSTPKYSAEMYQL